MELRENIIHIIARGFKGIKSRMVGAKDEFFLVAIIMSVALASFGIGRLSQRYEMRPSVRIETPPFSSNNAAAAVAGRTLPPADALYVASKNGKKYYFPWCAGVEKIKEENKIWFTSAHEAEQAGYTKAANCKGL